MASPEGPAGDASADTMKVAPSARASIAKRASASAGTPAAASTDSPPPSESRKSVTATAGSPPAAAEAGATGGPSPPSHPRKSVIAGAAGTTGATGGPSPSSEPRKSIIAGAAGASTPNAPAPPGTEAAATGAEPAGAPPTPASTSSSQHPQSPAPSTPSKETAGGEPGVKKTPPTPGWDYSQPLPNRFFRPSLTDLCFPVLAKNFVKFPGFGNLPADERLRVVNDIDLDLPLQLTADLIPEEAYWKRRVQSKWRNCDINAHGRSWKQLFFERNLAEALERFDRTVDKESSLEELMKTSAPYVHTLDIVELPSHISFLLLFNILRRDLAALRVNFGDPHCGWNYDRKKWGMKRSDCLSLSAALSVTATLTSLHLSSNHIDPEKMGILAKGLMANPTVVDLDLSSNVLSDEGVREVAKVVKANNSVLGMLNLARNHITAQGCVYLAECEDVNKSLVSLNLCFNQFGDLGGKRIIDWANNNTCIQEAGKQMNELWVSNCGCGEELEKKILEFLIERLFGRTCFHHPAVRETPVEEPASQGEKVQDLTEEEAKKKEEEAKVKEEKEDRPPGYEEDEVEKKEREEKEAAEKQAQEQAAAAAAAQQEAEEKAKAEAKGSEDEEIVHVGHGHGEACTLECSHMVGLPSTNPPPEPVVYSETAYASRDAQAAIKQIQEAKPYWGVDEIKDLKEKSAPG